MVTFSLSLRRIKMCIFSGLCFLNYLTSCTCIKHLMVDSHMPNAYVYLNFCFSMIKVLLLKRNKLIIITIIQKPKYFVRLSNLNNKIMNDFCTFMLETKSSRIYRISVFKTTLFKSCLN